MHLHFDFAVAFEPDVAVKTCPANGAVALLMVTVPVAVLILSHVIVFVALSMVLLVKV